MSRLLSFSYSSPDAPPLFIFHMWLEISSADLPLFQTQDAISDLVDRKHPSILLQVSENRWVAQRFDANNDDDDRECHIPVGALVLLHGRF